MKDIYIKKTFELAQKGLGNVSPNPLVGAVIVKNGQIIGEGYHKIYGGPHAEVEAISNSSEEVEGSTLYCNLEPCSHTNKQTPPCTDLLIKKKIKKVVVASKDPNPFVNGKGLQILKDHGIEVEWGILEDEAFKLNEVYFCYIGQKRPFVHLKLAQTLDGRTATKNFNSKWITSKKIALLAHKLRQRYDAVSVGLNTALYDDPQLTIRHGLEVPQRKKYRLIYGNIERLSLKEKLLTDQFREQTIIFTKEPKKKEYLDFIKSSPSKFIFITDLKESLAYLYNLKISSILLEGGSKLATSFLREHLVDKLTIFTAPKILGEGIPSIGDLRINALNEALTFQDRRMHIEDEHFVFEGTILT